PNLPAFGVRFVGNRQHVSDDVGPRVAREVGGTHLPVGVEFECVSRRFGASPADQSLAEPREFSTQPIGSEVLKSAEQSDVLAGVKFDASTRMQFSCRLDLAAGPCEVEPARAFALQP